MAKKKYMTESEAWAWVADRCRNHLIMLGDFFPKLDMGNGYYSWGLCNALDKLNYYDLQFVSKTMQRKMQKRLLANKPNGADRDDFWWPETKEGYEQRAKLCDKLAKETAPKKAGKLPKKPASASKSKKRPPARLKAGK